MATRAPEEIRRSIERNRAELAASVGQLRGRVRRVSDWRAQVNRNRGKAIVGAALTGFVLAGGIAGASALLFGRRGGD
jgi:hypothetical protein